MRRRQRKQWKNYNGSYKPKSNFAQAAHFFCIFLCRCFARLQRKTSRNFLVSRFMEEMSYLFLYTFFSLPLIFTLVADSIYHFLTAATKFHDVVFPTKKMSPLLFSLALALRRSFSRWASLACRLLSLFLCLPLSLYSIFVDMTINLSLIL